MVADNFPKAIADESRQSKRGCVRRTRATGGSAPALPRAYLSSRKVDIVRAHDRNRVRVRPSTFIDLRRQFIRNGTVGDPHVSEMSRNFRSRHKVCELSGQKVKSDERNQD